MENLRKYLLQATQSFKQATNKAPVSVVLGNVSADMDSVVGSIFLSYFYHLREQKTFIPVINSKQEEFRIKLEVRKHLESLQIFEDHLVFYEQLHQKVQENHIALQEVALFDHNQLDVNQEAALAKYVTRIVDHHVDSNCYADQIKEKRLQLVGSATTLVIEDFLKNFGLAQLDKEFSLFLAAPIVLDSYYFTLALKDSKWTELDFSIHQELLCLADVGREYWVYLDGIKQDIGLNLQLGCKNILIKDYKSYFVVAQGTLGLGVASIVIPIHIFVKEIGLDEIAKVMEEMMKEKKLGFFGIVTNYFEKDSYHKELMFYQNENLTSAKESKFLEFMDILRKDEQYQLQDEQIIKHSETGSFYIWTVGNLKMSRKNLEVLIKSFYK